MNESIVIDTPDGMAFFRALARRGAMQTKVPGIFKVVKDVYGYPGGPKAMLAMHEEFIDATLEIRAWPEARAKVAQEVAQEAIRRAQEEYGEQDENLKTYADSNVQAFFESGSISEQQGNDACLLIFAEVIRQRAGSR